VPVEFPARADKKVIPYPDIQGKMGGNPGIEDLAAVVRGQIVLRPVESGEGVRIIRSVGSQKVVFDEDDVSYSVIGHVDPVGLCGSGLVDLTAELLRSGLVNSVGRMLPPDELPDGIREALRRRVIMEENQPAFVLAEPRGDSRGVGLRQKDIRELQLATGAIRAGITILLKQAGISVGDLKRVLIAGGFGSFIRRNNAQRIGLLPPGIDHSRIHYIGNASLAGAKWALVSTNARNRGEHLARLARHVELSRDMEFQLPGAMRQPCESSCRNAGPEEAFSCRGRRGCREEMCYYLSHFATAAACT